MTITQPVVRRAAASEPSGPVVALVPAKDRADSVAATVSALRGVTGVDEVVVVDDGSGDATAEAARAAGARVVSLAENQGKGGAVRAGVLATHHAGVYLLIDADLGATAAMAGDLLSPVLGGDADMTIAVLPSAGGKGGFGGVRRLAGIGIGLATGGRFRPRAPLSGQRAVDAHLLRSLPLAERFGLETALSIDAVRAGARVVEIDVAMDHRHTGRSLAGFRHRATQGLHIACALWPRLTTRRQRGAGVVGTAALVLAAVARRLRRRASGQAGGRRAGEADGSGRPRCRGRGRGRRPVGRVARRTDRRRLDHP